jgi:hypothetical protein
MMRPVGDVKVYLHRAPIDMRTGRNGLAALVREGMQQDPFAPQALYVFIGRRYVSAPLLSDTPYLYRWHCTFNNGTEAPRQPWYRWVPSPRRYSVGGPKQCAAADRGYRGTRKLVWRPEKILANEKGKHYKCRLVRRCRADSGLRRRICSQRWLIGGTSAEMRNVCFDFAFDSAMKQVPGCAGHENAPTASVIDTGTNDAQCRLYEDRSILGHSTP